jgi:LuxR family maltose regulon positive regulatory protein
MVDLASLAAAPDQLLALAAHLLTWGDLYRGGQYLDLLERAQPSIAPESRLAARFATMRSVRYALMGRVDEAVSEAFAARAIQEQARLADDWTATLPMILMSAFEWLEDFPAVERESVAALAAPELTEPVRLVVVPGARALAWFESGRLAEAADAATAADSEARRLGFSQHFFAVDYLRVLAGLALERRDLNAAERLAERALSLSERGRPAFEFLVLLDLARIWAARGQVRDALTTIEAARHVLAATGSVLLARADELEALLRLSIGDLNTPVKLATGLPTVRHGLLLAGVALAAGDHRAAYEQLQSLSPCDLTQRQALVRRILLAAAAIVRGDPMTAGILGGVLESARDGGFVNTVVTTAPQVTSYLVENSVRMRPDPFARQLIAAALEVRAAQPEAFRPGRGLVESLTAAELRILKFLPTSTYLQMADTLYISRNTVKARLRSVYRKLGVASRSEAIERAIDLRLL